MNINCDLISWKDILAIINSIAIIILVIIAICGYNIWKKQLIAKRKLDIAEEALALFYEVKDVFKYIRNPEIKPSELDDSSMKKGSNESYMKLEIQKRIESAYITFKRVNKEQDFFRKLGNIKYRYKIYFGEDKLKPFNEIENVVNDLLKSSNMLGFLISLEQQDSKTKDEKFNAYIKQKNLRQITTECEEYDEIKKRIDESIKDVEIFCIKIINKLPE